jgi:uncharacterized protein (TIGR03435 family)
MRANRCMSVLAGLAWLSAHAVFAQTAKLEFEVASVKASAPVTSVGGVRISGGPATRDPERFTFTGATLRALLFRAYGLIDIEQQITGPEWIGKERYAVSAKIPAGTTQAQFQEMLQNLLTERFQMTVHHDSKVLTVYELVAGKNGPKLKAAAGDAAPSGQLTGAQDRDGFPVVPPGYAGVAMHGGQSPSGQVTQNWVFGQ